MNYNGADSLGLGGGTSNRPDQIAKVSYPHKRLEWFSTNSFANPVGPWAGGLNQGFGNAGSIVAKILAEKKARVIAISDSRGGVFNSRGIDPLKAALDVGHQGLGREIRRRRGAVGPGGG